VAREEIVHVTDDLDGTEATTSVRFTVDGVEYAIDLNEKNAAKFHKALAPYVNAAHPVRPTRTGKRTGAKSSPAALPGQEGAAIRAWPGRTASRSAAAVGSRAAWRRPSRRRTRATTPATLLPRFGSWLSRPAPQVHAARQGRTG